MLFNRKNLFTAKGNFRFKALNRNWIGPGQARSGCFLGRGLRVQFTFDVWGSDIVFCVVRSPPQSMAVHGHLPRPLY